MSGTPSDVANRLIASLEAGAEIVDRGEFTIDATKARDKLRDYQLADPDAWVLLVVELATLLGAKAVYFDYTEPRLTQIRFRSPGLAREELAEPLAGVFASTEAGRASERARRRAWQKLAIATNALLGRAERVEMTCLDDAGKGPRVRWAGEAFELDELALDPEQSGNALLVGFADERHVERETALLRRACRCSPILVMAGSEKLSQGWKAMFQSTRRRDDDSPAPEVPTFTIRDDDFRALGLAAKLHSREPARVRIQTNAVFAEDIELEGLRKGFAAIVDLDLARDLSQSQVLRDEAFDRTIALVRAAHDQIHR
ncbi:hypothetical protein ACNOYE_34485 [Nannocystaceae bacterium ST9]